jgi:hypothetical protein
LFCFVATAEAFGHSTAVSHALCLVDDVANSIQIEHLDSKEAWNAEYLSLPAEVHPRNGSRHLLCVAGLLLSLPVATTRRIVEAGMTSRIHFEEMFLALFALLNSESGVVSANAALFQRKYERVVGKVCMCRGMFI